MSRIAFVQYPLLENLGVMSISSVLKKHGHISDVFCLNGEKDFYKSLFDFKPDIVACSLSIGEQKYALEILRGVKKIDKNMITLIGGPYVLVFPEIINEDCIDLMCVGDGEFACLEILNRIDKKENFFNIPGIWVKEGKQIYESPNIAYVKDIKQLPGLNRDIYYEKYPELRNLRTKPFILSRGCPFQCSFCYTQWINQFYKKRAGAHFRLDLPEKVISEILYVKEKYGLEWVRFHDGTLNADLKYIKKFLKMYSEKDLPGFIAYARVENIDEEFVFLLREAGCDKLVLGIQSGDENLRKKLANRKMSNEQIINACNLLKKYKIRIGVDVMFGWPEETMKNAYETIKLCRKINPDDINSNVLVPYPKTKIGDYCIENNYLGNIITYKDVVSTVSSNCSLLKQNNINQLINMDKLCYLAIRFPKLQWLINLLIKLPPNKLFLIIKDIPSIRRHFKYEIKNYKERFAFLRSYLKGVVKE